MFDSFDQGATMDQQTSIAANVDDEATHDSIGRSPENVSDQVAVVVTGDHPSLFVGSDVSARCEPADALAVDFVSARREDQYLVGDALRQIECAGDFYSMCWESPEGL